MWPVWSAIRKRHYNGRPAANGPRTAILTFSAADLIKSGHGILMGGPPMTSPATLPDLARRLLVWLGIPGLILGLLAGLVIFRDTFAVAPDKHNGDILSIETGIIAHTADYQQTAEKSITNCRGLKQATINGYLDQITNINIKKAGAAQEVRAVLLQLENKINQQIAKAESEKAEC